MLCRLDEIDPETGRAVMVTLDGKERELVLVRVGDEARAYYNSCPHQGVPLDWRPGQFMSLDRQHIQCATHGALFEPADGRCIFGPCKGASLRAVPVQVVDGVVTLRA